MFWILLIFAGVFVIGIYLYKRESDSYRERKRSGLYLLAGYLMTFIGTSMTIGTLMPELGYLSWLQYYLYAVVALAFLISARGYFKAIAQ